MNSSDTEPILKNDKRFYRPRKRSICCSIFLLILSVLCFVLAAILPSLIDSMVHKQVEEQIPLRVNGSLTYSPWVSPPTPVYFQFWLFDILNPDEIVSKGAKPFLVQRGPLTYLEKRQKVDIVFHDNNGTVSYREIRTYHYQPHLSQIKETDNFTNINLPLLVFGNTVRYLLPNMHKFFEDIFKTLDENGLFIQKTAAEVIWGYEDPALKKAAPILELFNIHMDTMVGIFYGKNGTDDGHYNVYTGSENLSQFLHVHTWKDQVSLSIWSTDEANQVNGTDGTMFPPFLDKSQRQYIFTSDLCRSIYVEYLQENSVKNVPTYFFAAPDSVYAAPQDNPDNIGYCIPNCLPAGLLNMSRCIPQAPVVMSPPHFYQTDPEVLKMVDGLSPSSDCRTELSIEPTTGLVLNAQKKLQINLAVEPVSGFPDMEKLPPLLYLPYLWLNESGLVDEGSAAQLRGSVVLAARLRSLVPIVSNLLGGLALFITIVIIIVILYRRSRYSHSRHATFGRSSKQNVINTTIPDHSLQSNERV